MQNQPKDNAGRLIPPLLLFFICLGIGFILEYILPFHIPGISRAARISAGSLFLFASAVFVISALIVMIKNNTPFDPAKETLAIVKEGPFRFSRNPMYLSLLLLMAGIAFIKMSLWLFFTGIVLFILLKFLSIRPEEKYLSQKFGQQYIDYKNRVRRWI